MFYYQYLKRGRLRIRYHPKLSDEVRIARGDRFEGRIEALNIGNVSTLILSVSMLNPPPLASSSWRMSLEEASR
jgi:hypothetical protein